MSAAPMESKGSDPALRLRLRLFVAGDEPNSRQARHNLAALCQEYLAGRAEVEIIDVLKDFRAAVAERVLVTPALIVGTPPARVVVLGNLSDTARVLAALGLTGRPS
jgi:circadian clock protein KaiB